MSADGKRYAANVLRLLLRDYHDIVANDREWFWVDQVEGRLRALEAGLPAAREAGCAASSGASPRGEQDEDLSLHGNGAVTGESWQPGEIDGGQSSPPVREADAAPRHVCGMVGYGAPGDICPACEFYRLRREEPTCPHDAEAPSSPHDHKGGTPTAVGLGSTGRAYWDRGAAAVPVMTGAATVLDCGDLRDACARLGLPTRFVGRVLDVGCGTGRLAQLCDGENFGGGYHGVDISRDAVTYATGQGREAAVLDGYGPDALTATVTGTFEWVCCFSVFTHIDAGERADYLWAFGPFARNLIVDVIPGDGSGDVVLWTADLTAFTEDLGTAGWQVRASADRVSPDGVTHRYLWCQR